ncbi:MAG TPA: 2,3-epoxybenzoyl-CoA dihydrolase [Stellaceae bacterium]
MIDFDTDPSRYKHWRLDIDGAIATLSLNVAEDGGIKPGYQLKLNSYDLGVDIELYDALNRIRFEHPEVGAVVITSARDRVFSAGANIYMLASSAHAFKVNFCKFTNETRNGMEDSSAYSGLKFLAAINGACAGGGYELALACDEIAMIDDRSTTVSLPEVPLLGVLPGTGGLTRLIDKRKVRRDLADMFCTTAEGVRAGRAKEWKLVDEIAPPQRFAAMVKERAAALAKPRGDKGIAWTKLRREIGAEGYNYDHVAVAIDRAARTATITVAAPDKAGSVDHGASWWPLAMARELDDAILLLRLNELEIGTILLKTRGDAQAVLDADSHLLAHRDDWLVRETIGFLRRTLSRLDVSSRSLFAIVEPGSCFAGTLLELALAADRTYMLAAEEGDNDPPRLVVSQANLDLYPMANGLARLANRFGGDAAPLGKIAEHVGKPLDAETALALGLVTVTPDELDWDDEIRLAIEERASLSPDALTGLEASLRFAGPETMATRVFGRLSAWQNWIFNRSNATGAQGALKLFGTGTKPKFDWERV